MYAKLRSMALVRKNSCHCLNQRLGYLENTNSRRLRQQLSLTWTIVAVIENDKGYPVKLKKGTVLGSVISAHEMKGANKNEEASLSLD